MTALGPLGDHPRVAVFMAVRDEESTLAAAVTSVLEGGLPDVAVVIAVGPSADRTREIAEALAADPRVRVVDNPAGTTPHGLNAAIAAADADVLVRMDGHGELPAGYLATAVRALRDTGAANVGGRMVPDAHEPWPRAVAVAMRSRFGIGGAGHRVGGEPGPAASVFLGAFRREALAEVGGYDEHFLRAQDWELNYRLRAAGHVVWFVPQMEVAYRPRRTWRALWRQFHQSGRWRREVMRTHRQSASARYLAAPLLVTGLAVGVSAAVAGAVLGAAWLLWVGLVPLVAYLAGVMVATALLTPQTGGQAAWRMPAVLVTMHVAWGTGFVRGVG